MGRIQEETSIWLPVKSVLWGLQDLYDCYFLPFWLLGASGWSTGCGAESPEDQPELGAIATGILRSLENGVVEALEWAGEGPAAPG